MRDKESAEEITMGCLIKAWKSAVKTALLELELVGVKWIEYLCEGSQTIT